MTRKITGEMVAALEAIWLKLDDTGWGDLATTEPNSPHRLAAQAIQILKARRSILQRFSDWCDRACDEATFGGYRSNDGP
jgi:hypothetical protein